MKVSQSVHLVKTDNVQSIAIMQWLKLMHFTTDKRKEIKRDHKPMWNVSYEFNKKQWFSDMTGKREKKNLYKLVIALATT